MKKFALENPNANVMMIGAGPGVMGIALLEDRHPINLSVVDNVSDYYFITHLELAGMSKEYLKDRLSSFIQDSSTLGKNWIGGDLDLLIVDGDHLQDGVEKDIDAWLPHVKVGGLIFFHDYEKTIGGGDTGVKEAIENKKTKEWELVDRLGISIVFRKMG